jgi:hypothetical protein
VQRLKHQCLLVLLYRALEIINEQLEEGDILFEQHFNGWLAGCGKEERHYSIQLLFALKCPFSEIREDDFQTWVGETCASTFAREQDVLADHKELAHNVRVLMVRHYVIVQDPARQKLGVSSASCRRQKFREFPASDSRCASSVALRGFWMGTCDRAGRDIYLTQEQSRGRTETDRSWPA